MPNVYQLTITGSSFLQFCQNIMHFELSEGGSGGPYDYAKALLDSWHSSLVTDWLACLPSDYTLSSARAKRVTGTGGPVAIDLQDAGMNGSRAGTLGMSSNAPLVEFPVLLNGKNVTGKIFFPGANQDDIVENRLLAALETVVDSFGATLLNPLTLSGGLGTAKFCIFNRATKTDTIATISRIPTLVGTQRRRLHPT